jgi:hypothetical protein
MPYTPELDTAGTSQQIRLAREIQRRRQEEQEAARGYPASMSGNVARAQDAAEREWQQLVDELTRRQTGIMDDPNAQRLQQYYEGIMSGEDLPYGRERVASEASRVSAGLFQGARAQVDRLRDRYAARGLGRSGGLGSQIGRMMTGAATGAARASGDVRNLAAQQNFDARTGAAGGLQSLYGGQQDHLTRLTEALAGYRSQRSFDPNQFREAGGRFPRETTTEGGYSPPPKLQVRFRGQSAPTYQDSWGVSGRRS